MEMGGVARANRHVMTDLSATELGLRGPLKDAGLSFATGIVSIALHGAVIAAALSWQSETPGAIALPTEAVSVEIVRSDVVEAIDVEASADAVQSAASASAAGAVLKETSPQDLEAAKEIVPDEVKTLPDRAPQDQAMRRDPHVMDVLEGTHESTQDVRRGERQMRHVERVLRKAEKPREKPQKAKAASGGAASRSMQGRSQHSGKVSASAGSVRNYAAIVRARVAGRRPPGSGKRGTVVVAFAISRAGGLSYVRLAGSSGDAVLDRTVLSAVRSAAPFPTPPPGAQLQFSMPFYFR